MLKGLAAGHSYQRFESRQPTEAAWLQAPSGASYNQEASYPSFGLSGEFITVPDSFEAKPGAKLTDDLFIGNPLGCGLQVGDGCLTAPSVLEHC